MTWLDRFRKEGRDTGRRESPAAGGTKLRVPEGDEAAIWTKGKSILGEYTVERVLGEGGMGTVYLLVRSHSTGQRFAVKKTKFRDETIQRAFLRELQLWLDLPEHPHLVSCRFFRTIQDELAIFAEYVEGGALTRWIADRRLTEVPRILDVAIQFAWGLHALHELGLVHQDVKPGNVLMTNDGVAKVSDFGLARARVATGEGAAGGGQDTLLSCGGMTEAYCSPEQAAFQSLTRKTDIWSWGVSVLEMFTGGVTWASGVVADHALDAYVERYGRAGVGAEGLPLMPAELVAVLRKCFRPDPQDRWDRMLEVTETLREMYREYGGTEYSRNEPTFIGASERKVFLDERKVVAVKHWLAFALKADGRDPAEGAGLIPPREGSRRAQSVADLAGYDEAQRIFERLVANGREDLLPELAKLYMNKATVHGHLDDAPGALAAYDRALAIWERLVNQDGRQDLAQKLANTHTGQGRTFDQQGNFVDAVAAYDQALAIWERLVSQEGRWELAGDLALTYMNKGNTLRNQGDRVGAVAIFDQSLTILERLVNQEGRSELAGDLALTYMNKGTTLREQGNLNRAVAVTDQALAILQQQVDHGRKELANLLAATYLNKGVALHDLGNLTGAIAAHDQALSIRERLVNQEGRRDLADDLALTYMNKGCALAVQENSAGAVAAFDEAIAIRDRLVRLEGRRDLLGDLAWVRLNRAYHLADSRERVSEARQAISVLKEEVRRTGRADLKRVLSWAAHRRVT
jgi:serine/threonine protein kinase